MVDRYEPEFLEEYDWNPIRKDDDGDYVLYSDYEALEAQLAALVKAAQRLVDHAKNADQELWASLPDVIVLRDAIERTK